MPEKNQEVKLTEELLREYSGARSEWATQAVEDSEFRSGAQWTKDQINKLKARNQAPVVVNCIHNAVEQAKDTLQKDVGLDRAVKMLVAFKDKILDDYNGFYDM